MIIQTQFPFGKPIEVENINKGLSKLTIIIFSGLVICGAALYFYNQSLKNENKKI